MTDAMCAMVAAITRVDTAHRVLLQARQDLMRADLGELASTLWTLAEDVKAWNDDVAQALKEEQERREACSGSDAIGPS